MLSPEVVKALASALVGSQTVPNPSGMIEPGNINLHTRPVVKNSDGSISTVRSASFNDGKNEVLIPTVLDNPPRVVTVDQAIDNYRRTGQHLGKFDSPQSATKYALSLHEDQSREYGKGAP